jgi:hypothetical protein
MSPNVKDRELQKFVQSQTRVNGSAVEVAIIPDASTVTALLNSTTTAYANSLIVKASSGKLFSMNGHNSKNQSQFIHVYNSATLPANGAVPEIIILVPSSTSFFIDMHEHGRYFSNGIVIGNSSTGPTKTIGVADCWFDVQYI